MSVQLFKSLVLFFACLAPVANAETMAAPDVWKDFEATKRSLPKDASSVLDRAVDCDHLGGEINGDGSKHDKEIIRTVAKLHCDKVENDVLLIKRKYKDDSAVQKAFKTYYESE